MRDYSRILRLVAFVVGLALLYVGYIWVQPRLTAYQTRQVLKLACYDIIRRSSSGRTAIENLPEDAWEPEFRSRLRRNGLGDVDPDNYSFELSIQGKDVVCDGAIDIELTTHWVWLEDFVEIEPYQTQHHVTFTHKVVQKL